jgi:hypothetical protein
MAKYLVLYHGGSRAETEEAGKEVMAQWMKWFESIGPSVVDGGNPTAASKTIAPGGKVSEGAGTQPATGYSVLSADSLDAAVKLAQGCPHLRAGGTIAVYETLDMM